MTINAQIEATATIGMAQKYERERLRGIAERVFDAVKGASGAVSDLEKHAASRVICDETKDLAGALSAINPKWSFSANETSEDLGISMMTAGNLGETNIFDEISVSYDRDEYIVVVRVVTQRHIEARFEKERYARNVYVKNILELAYNLEASRKIAQISR